MESPITVSALSRDDREAMVTLDQSAFAFDARNLDVDLDLPWLEWNRAWGARRGDALAGIYAVFSFEVPVPARPPESTVVRAMAGLSWVAVHPDHRRKGVLSAMIRHHFDDVRGGERQEAVSLLFASEPGIYGRFGYGRATEAVHATLPSGIALRHLPDHSDVTTTFEALDRERHRDLIVGVYERAARARPGLAVRPVEHWSRQLDDPVRRRPPGVEDLKIVLARRAGLPTGYAIVRRTSSFSDVAPDGKVRVVDLRAIDTPSLAALWRRVLDFDLMQQVSTPELALDDPLFTWAEESVVETRPTLGLWARLVDLPAALAGRGYSSDVDVVIEVTDACCPWNAGRWHLKADGDSSACEPTSRAADLSADVRELGAAYLGGVTLSSLAAAGLVAEHTPGALAATSTAWRGQVLPGTPYMF